MRSTPALASVLGGMVTGEMSLPVCLVWMLSLLAALALVQFFLLPEGGGAGIFDARCIA